MAYPMQLRRRVVDAVRIDGMTQAQAAKTFRVAERTVRGWLARDAQGQLQPRSTGSTRPRKATGRVVFQLWEMVQQRPGITSEEAAAKLGGLLSAGHIRKQWKAMGLSFKKEPAGR